MNAFRIMAALMVFFGAQNDMEVALSDYEKKKAEGKDPIFRESDIGLDNTDVWH